LRISVVTFPGSNCDYDAYRVCLSRGHQTKLIWHKDTDLANPDLVILPGGFSYGDYLRGGALARFSPIVNEVISFAKKGGLLLGICNGFQILTECSLLPGTLLMNESLLFICKHQYIRVETEASPFTQSIGKGKVLDVPIAHKEGNFYTDSVTLKQLQDNNQIIFRYCDKQGEINLQSNPNGSLDNIAGICNPQRNILGMMPHPERSATDTVPTQDGKWIFEAIEKALE